MLFKDAGYKILRQFWRHRFVERIKSVILSIWKKIRQHPWISTIVILGLLLITLLLYQHYILGMTAWADWTGFGDYMGPLTKDQRGKTLWDLLELLIVPLVLGIGALLFNKAERANELKIATDQQREQELQNYIDKMTELLLDKSIRKSEPKDEIRVMARTRTLTTLRLLDSMRKGILLRFLFEAGLINKEENIVDLRCADLSGANLAGAYLRSANLEGVYLRGAYLRGAYLRGADLGGDNLRGADLMGATLADVDLGYANLIRANLMGADLRGANLRGADLRLTNLKGANLVNANLDDAHIMSATLEGAIMPDGKKYDTTIHQFG